MTYSPVASGEADNPKEEADDAVSGGVIKALDAWRGETVQTVSIFRTV